MTALSPNALVRHVFSMRASIMRWVDDERRPLHEGRSPQEVWPPQMQRVRCKYQDARAHSSLPMNVSALASVSRDMPYVHDVLGALRGQLFDLAPGEPANVLQMSQIVSTGWSLAYWRCFAATARGAPPPSLAPQVASLFKVCIGLSWLARMLLKSMPAAAHARTFVGATDLLSHVDRTHALFGTHEVCAAPLEMVGSVLETLIAGTRTRTAPTNAVDQVLVPDAHAAAAYAKAQHDLIYWLSASTERVKALSPELMTQAAQTPRPPWVPWWLSPGLQKEAFELRWDGSDPARSGVETVFAFGERNRAAAERLRERLGVDPPVARALASTLAYTERRFHRSGAELRRCIVANAVRAT